MTETVNLTEKQISKINVLIEKAELNFETDDINKCSIYKFYAQRYGIIIIASWIADEDEFKVLDAKTKAPINGKELDLKIQEIMNEYSKAKRTIEHVKDSNDGKIHTITSTSYVQPNSKILDIILNSAKAELPLNIRIEAARRVTQKTYSELKDLTFEQLLERQIEMLESLRICNDLIAEQFKAKKSKAYNQIEQAHRSAQIKANKKQPKASKVQQPKMSKQDQGIWNMLAKGATQEQFESKKAQMRAMGLLDILEESKNLSSTEDKKFSISTTKSKEESYD